MWDTSALIPLFYGDHLHHEACMGSFERLDVAQGFCASHRLIEAYSSMTRMPGKYRVPADQARSFIAELREKL